MKQTTISKTKASYIFAFGFTLVVLLNPPVLTTVVEYWLNAKYPPFVPFFSHVLVSLGDPLGILKTEYSVSLIDYPLLLQLYL